MEWGDCMKVLIADDQADVRSALKILLEQENEIFIFNDARDLDDLLFRTEYTQPDLILLDWELSNQIMADTVPLLRRLDPGVRIIALSGRPEAAREALDSGADAFVSKGENPEKLLDAIYSHRP